MREWYVVMRKMGWENLSFSGPVPVRVSPPDDPLQPVAFLPVFATYKAAAAWAEGAPVQPIGELADQEEAER